MKKLSAILLCALLLFSACVPDTNVSDTVSDTVSEESKEEFAKDPAVDIINSLVSAPADRTKKAENIFEGLKYTFDTEPVADYGDPNFTKLTDGATRELFDRHCWVAFKNTSSVAITFDISGKSGLSDVEIGVLQQMDYGIYYPTKVMLQASADGENFTTVSTLETPEGLGHSSKYTYRFALPKALESSHIRLVFQKGNTNFLFIDEIFGYAFTENGTIDIYGGQTAVIGDDEYDFYGYSLNTDITVPVSDTDADYTAYQNLALLQGTDIQVSHFDPMPETSFGPNTPIETVAKKLTDGKKASSAHYSDSAFSVFQRAGGRHVVVDLGNEMAVDKVSLETLNFVSAGVGTPPAVAVSVSTDGKEWVSMGGVFSGVYGDGKVQNVTLDIPFEDTYICRYVRVSFQTVPHNNTTSSVYMSEIEVWGKKDTSSATEAVENTTSVAGNYPDPEVIGSKAMILTALGNISDGNALYYDEALANYGYYDKDGKLTDYFFDSVLMAPANWFARTADIKATVESWISELTAPDCNLAVIEKAVGDINASLGEDRKVTVWLNLWCPHTDNTCADIDGDGTDEDFSKEEDRLAFLKWQIDSIISAFNGQGYENITLAGLYWNDECLHEDYVELERSLIADMNEYIHSLGYKSFWCPYYNAYGIWWWYEMGFDFACLQPNYMFYATETTRLATTAELAKIYGMCVEIEIEDIMSEGSCGIYREYLRAGVDSGYMNSVQLYYQGGTPGAIYDSMDEKDDYTVAIYHDTYLYTHDKLDDTYNLAGESENMDVFKDISVTVLHGEKASFVLGDLNNITYTIVCSPLFGSLRINADGTCTYKAMDGYMGGDTVSLILRDGAGNTKTVNINITVE